MLRFEPHYKLAPWGGRRLAEEFGRRLPEGPVGESWELVDFDEQHSRVRSGPLTGKHLRDLWQQGQLGGSASGPFPFLLKWLTPEERLSVQVHPDAPACDRLAEGRPKTEAWFFAHAEPGSIVMVGHYPGMDAATLRQAAQGGTIHKWLYESGPRPGDMLLVPGGTLHSIGPGFILLEVQQPSDTTYRVYDWGRLGLDGQPRELHLEAAAEAVNFESSGPPRPQRGEIAAASFVMRQLKAGTEVAAGPLRVFVSGLGAVKLVTERGEESLAPGDVVVAEQADGTVRVASGSCVLVGENA